MEPLLVRFTKAQRAWIRRIAKQTKNSEAGVIRGLVELVMEKNKTK